MVSCLWAVDNAGVGRCGLFVSGLRAWAMIRFALPGSGHAPGRFAGELTPRFATRPTSTTSTRSASALE
ncbi:hypothetical protein BCEP27_30946 [Burkholderia cepacia]